MFNDVWLHSYAPLEYPRLNHLYLHRFSGFTESEIQVRVKQKDHMIMQKTWGNDKHDTQICHMKGCNIGVKFDFAVQNSRQIFQLRG